MKRFCVLILAAFCLTSCHWFEPSGKDRQVLLIYLAGNNSLSAEGEADLYDIEQSWLPSVRDKDKGVLIYYHFSDGVPTLSRFYKDRSDVTVEDVIKTYPTSTNSASAATLATVLADAENAWPAERHSLILWSHGSGFLPEGYYAQPRQMAAPGDRLTDAGPDPYAWMVKAGDGSKSFGEDHGSEMDIKEVSQALGVNKYEFILFDACLMANVEIAYELRNNCDYLLFSPTEILADGFPYEKMVQPVFSLNAKDALKNIAVSYMEHYRAMTGDFQSATVTIVETAGLPALASACKPIFQNHQDRILTLDRSQVQPYFRFNKHWFYDLDHFVQQVATDAEYQQFKNALAGAVIFKDTTEKFLGIEMKNVSGLSVYIPRAEYTVLNTYYKTLAWNQATGLVQ